MQEDLTNIAREYCRSHGKEYHDWVGFELSRILSAPRYIFLGTATFVLLTIINYVQVYGPDCLPAFSLSILLFLAYRPLHQNLGQRMERAAPFYMDAIILSVLLGICYMIFLAKSIDRPLVNAPLQIGLFVASTFSFHSTPERNLGRNILFAAIVVGVVIAISWDYFLSSLIQYPTALLPGIYLNNYINSNLHIRYYSVRINSQAREHAFRQLASAFYPHQVERMEAGENLADTMPVGRANAYVICFDIMDSSKVMHEDFDKTRDRIFNKCYEVMLENYTFDPLSANAHRIKDLGDGFLCSVGYPFAIPPGWRGADLTLELARRFISIFDAEVATLDYVEPIYCGIGISYGSVEAYYPSSGPTLYDMRDRAIILANRYEALRKLIFNPDDEAGEPVERGNIVVLQKEVYINLSSSLREQFIRWDTTLPGRTVRDDRAADSAYYRVFYKQNWDEHNAAG